MKKEIAIGCDHAGYELKEYLKDWLSKKGYSVNDQGTNSPDSVDYPDFAHAVAAAVAEDGPEWGILICGSANGVAMSANKHKDIRAALCWMPEIASLAKQHNNANVLCLPARYISTQEAEKIVEAFMEAEFEGGRHERRVNKIAYNC